MTAPTQPLQRDGRPLYQSVHQQLIAELEAGTWKPGDMLPTETELSRRYGVSPGTVRQAVLALVRDGLLSRTAGKGTFVTRLDSSRSFARFFRFRESSSGADEVPRILMLGWEILRPAPEHVTRHLGIAADAPVLALRRLLLRQGEPICLYRSFLPYELVAGLEEEDLEDDRLYAIIEKRKGLHVLKAEELLRAGIASAEEADLLHVKLGDPIIKIDRTAHTHQNTVLEWRETVGRSDHFYYKITMP